MLNNILAHILFICHNFFIGNFEGAAICVLALLLFLVPSFLEGAMKIKMAPLFEAIIYCFIFASLILGELAHYYSKIPFWDTMLHTLNGFLFAAVGFSTVDLLNRSSKKIKLSPLYLTLVAFCVSMTIGVLWEFFECGMDLFFGKDMQKDTVVQTIHSCELDPEHDQNVFTIEDIVYTEIITGSGETYTVDDGYLDIGILDSMKDLFVNFIGAIVFCISGFIYEKHGENKKLAASVVKGLRVTPTGTEETSDEPEQEEPEAPAKKEKRKKKKGSE